MKRPRITRRPRRVLRGLAVASVLLSACSDGDSASTMNAVAARPDFAFDHARYVALEQTDTDAFETVTALAHVCSVAGDGCPDGSEPLVILGSHEFMPHDAHLSAPDAILEPPVECLADGTYCVLSVAKCTFSSRADQIATQHCVPGGSHIDVAGAAAQDGEQHECVDDRSTHSRHVDLDCVRDVAVDIDGEEGS